jgi:hypothetical protein
MNVEAFHKRLNELYMPSCDQFTLVDVPEINYIAIDGEGNPESDAFQGAMKWVYSCVHIIKPLAKEKMGKKFVEPPLECLFWADNEKDFIAGNKDKWKWRVMVVVIPEWVSQQAFQDAVKKAEKKLGSAPKTMRYQEIHEGKSVQIMHVGDYGKIQSVCDTLYNEFLPKNNLKPNGYYHEIYLNDPNRVAPEKRKTVIRQPVSRL